MKSILRTMILFFVVFLADGSSAFQAAAFCNAKHLTTGPAVLFSVKRDGDTDGYRTKEQMKRRRRRRNLDFWGVDMNMPSKSELQQRAAPQMKDSKQKKSSDSDDDTHVARKRTPQFPATFEDVAEQAFEAIAGTICGLQRPDPNVASNAMHSSVLDYRPTHSPYASIKRWSDGDEHPVSKKDLEAPARMGIEIDGASFLLSKEHIQSDIKGTAEGRAMIIFSLELAQRLVSPWNGFEEDASSDLRPCAVFYNTMDQALMASRELSRLKKEAHRDRNALDRIPVSWLGQGSLPTHMEKKRKKQPTTD